ncbi:hypothetical protein [Spirosoma arcticum]
MAISRVSLSKHPTYYHFSALPHPMGPARQSALVGGTEGHLVNLPTGVGVLNEAEGHSPATPAVTRTANGSINHSTD